MTLIYLSIAFVAGILVGSQFDLPVWSPAFALILLPFLLLSKHRKPVITSALCLLALFGGTFRFQSSQPVFDENHASFYNDSGETTLNGIVIEAPEVRDNSARIVLEARFINSGGDIHPVKGKALVFAPRYPEYRYGEVLNVSGRLETPRSSGEFDYKGYLADRGIYSVMYYPHIVVTDFGKGARPLGWIYSLRRTLATKLAEILPEPQAALAQGIVLGIRGDIPPDVNRDFALTGTSHILAISGQNLSIFAGMLIATGLWLFGKRHYLYIWLALVSLWLYSLLTGMSPPVVRSAIMLSLFLTADLLGRQRHAPTALAFAAAVMVAITPRLPWDASFQLSFLATLGLVMVAPLMQSFGRKINAVKLGEDNWKVKAANWLADNLAVTIAVILVVWPVIAYYFGLFSIIAPFATLLLLPILPAIIVTGALAALLALVAIPVGQAAGWVGWLFLSYMLAVIRGGALLPFASFDLGVIHPAVIWGYYGALAFGFIAFNRRKQVSAFWGKTADFLSGPVKRWLMPALLITAILATFFAMMMPDDRAHVSFLDVGQGDAILIQTGSTDILIDGGPSPRVIASELSRRLPFWDRTIELVILTHPHADHLAGLVEVLKRYRVRAILVSDTVSTSALWLEWEKLIEEKRIQSIEAKQGQVIKLSGGGLKLEVLNAPAFRAGDSIDNGGIVLRVSAGKISFLLTADITAEVEGEMVTERASLDSAVLKVAHHGSSTGTSAGFLAVVSPEVAVISVGADNDYGHPHKEVLARLGSFLPADHVYRTDIDGTIEFITDGERLWLRKGK